MDREEHTVWSRCGVLLVWWCLVGVVVSSWCGGVLVWQCHLGVVVLSWCDGVLLVGWCLGVVSSWCGGVSLVWCPVGVVVPCWCGVLLMQCFGGVLVWWCLVGVVGKVDLYVCSMLHCVLQVFATSDRQVCRNPEQGESGCGGLSV